MVVFDPAVELIDERGGRPYVWVTGKDFRCVEGCDRFELYLPQLLAQLPDELQFELRRFPRRLEAFWDGCAWVA